MIIPHPATPAMGIFLNQFLEYLNIFVNGFFIISHPPNTISW